jgi:hypothetical protein
MSYYGGSISGGKSYCGMGSAYYGGKKAYYGGKTAKQQNYQNVIKMVMARGMTLKQALIHIKKNNLYKK